MFSVWLWLVTLSLSVFFFYNIQFPFFLLLVITAWAFIWAVYRTLRNTRDYFHPIFIFSLSFLVRFWLPAALISMGIEPPPFLGQDWTVGNVWEQALALASVAHIALILGWVLTPKLYGLSRFFVKKEKNFLPSRSYLKAMLKAARFWFLIGLEFYMFFLLINFGLGGIIKTITSGILRSGEVITPGTSRYSFLAKNFLQWSAIVMVIAGHLMKKGILRSLMPVFIVFALFIPFGGRVVAFMPVVMGLMGVWYSGWRLRPSRKVVVLAAGAVIFGIYIATAIRAYRGGGGTQALIQGLSPSVVLHDNTLFWYELSMLHVYTYGILLGADSYRLPFLRYLFGGYTAYFLGLSKEIPHGTFIVWKMMGVKPNWGIHTGLPIDYYMSFGFMPMIAAMFSLGFILKSLYRLLIVSGARNPVLQNVAYVFIFWVLYWKVYERGLGILTIYESLIFLGIIMGTSNLLLRRKVKLSPKTFIRKQV